MVDSVNNSPQSSGQQANSSGGEVQAFGGGQPQMSAHDQREYDSLASVSQAEQSKTQDWSQNGVPMGKTAGYYGAPSGSGSGGGYRLDPDTANRSLNKIQKHLDDIKDDEQHYTKMRRVQPASQDGPTQRFTAAALTFANNSHAENKSYEKYLTTLHQKISASLKTYQAQEHSTAVDLRKQDPGAHA